jgi:hypothetical protein
VFDAPLPMDDAGPSGSLSVSTTVALLNEPVTLTALADDDFGVKAVTFYEGANVLATDTLPPYTASLTIPEAAPCAEHTLTAVVEDSLGQTASASRSLIVDCTETYEPEPEPEPTPTPEPTPNPQPTTPAKPSLPGTLPDLANGGTMVRVSPVAPGGIASVDFYLGARKICGRSGAPYECLVRPTGADVGSQALRVVVTDLLGQSAESSRTVEIERFKVRRFTTKAERLTRTSKTKGWRVAGRLELPSVVTTAQGCSSGRVTLVLKRGGATLADQQVSLKRDCTFSKAVRVPRSGAYRLSARFGGNAVLSPATADRRLS